MKTIGILFDVSGSMNSKFHNMNTINKLKKSDELIEILKNIGKNIGVNIFSIIFGLKDTPYIADFINLLQVSNSQFKKITSKNEISTFFREKLIKLLSKDKDGNERYCNIKEYVISPNGPSEKLSEFFCNIMEENREIVDHIYNSLPIEVTKKEENQSLNRKKNIGRGAAAAGGGIGVGVAAGVALFFIPVIGQIVGPTVIVGSAVAGSIGGGVGTTLIANSKIKSLERDETIKAINSSFKSSIEIIMKKLINENKIMNNQNYQIIKGENLTKLIQDISEKIIIPENKENFTIIDLFENFIYGNTPLYTSCIKALEIFSKNYSDQNILIIISDGLLNDSQDIISAQNEIIKKINELKVISICIYLNSSPSLNKKTFYNEIQPNFTEGSKFLFNISSKLNYHNNIIKFFVKNNWIIPLNGVCKLFIEINNSDDLNQFINLVNQSLNYKDPIEEVNNIIGSSILDKIIDENYIAQFKSENQIGGRCWAYSLSAVIYLASSRVFGRKIEKFDNILKKIKNEEKADLDPEEKQGRPVFQIAFKYLKLFKLRGKVVSSNEARNAVLRGRPCLAKFYLDANGWQNFSEFFNKNPKGILTKKIIEKKNDKITDTPGGHAIVLTEVEENCLKFLNSWGRNWADNGYFRIENENVLNLEFMDIFWYESDLTKEEKNKYNNNFLSFIKQASNYFSNPNINIKEQLKKEVKCQKCNNNLSLKFFELILRQNHIENDESDLRKLKIKCLKCKGQFESDSLTALLYLDNFLN